MKVLICAVVLSLALSAQGRVYSRCDLAKDMLRFTVFKANLADWVCLVENESSRNTAAVGGPNSNGSYDYGLFQLNDKYWCGKSGVGGDCNISCQSLLVDEGVAAAASCVQLVYNRHGFEAWYGWQRGCKGQTLPNLSAECGI